MAIAQSRWACACVLLWADGTISHSLSHALRLGTNTAACTKHNQSPSATSMVYTFSTGFKEELGLSPFFLCSPSLCSCCLSSLSSFISSSWSPYPYFSPPSTWVFLPFTNLFLLSLHPSFSASHFLSLFPPWSYLFLSSFLFYLPDLSLCFICSSFTYSKIHVS